MLFKTLYGPELGAVYSWVATNQPIDQKSIFGAFGGISGDDITSSANLEDTLSFLKSAGMVTEKSGIYQVTEQVECRLFKLHLLRRIRQIYLLSSDTGNSLDPYFGGILETLFIQQNKQFIQDLHSKINTINLPQPCSKEKVNAWKRIMEYLGVGFRAYGGFCTDYNLELLMIIIDEWPHESGILQDFLEIHLNQYLPWKTNDNEISFPVKMGLEILEQQKKISLSAKQDLPNKSYMGDRQIKWISKGCEYQ